MCYIQLCVCVYFCVWMCVCVCVCECVCVCVWMCVCVCECDRMLQESVCYLQIQERLTKQINKSQASGRKLKELEAVNSHL